MADLVQEDGQEVHRAGGGAAGDGAEVVGAEQEGELDRVAGRGVDEPAMAGGIKIKADRGAVGLTKDAVSEVGDQERRRAGWKGEALCGESLGPYRKTKAGEALKICGGERGGRGGEGRGYVSEKKAGGRRCTRRIGLGERSHSNLVACGRNGCHLSGRSTYN